MTPRFSGAEVGGTEEEQAMLMIIILRILAVVLASTSLVSAQVREGYLDLSALSEAHPSVTLAGDWQFYPHVASPAHLSGQIPQSLEVPGYWPLGEGGQGYGYGLYRLRVTHCTQPRLSLRLGTIHTAYRVWVNGQPVAQVGQPATDASHFVPEFRSELVSFAVPAETFNLSILVTNFAHRKGGILTAPQLGLPKSLQQQREAQLTEEVFLIAVIIALALYFAVFYLIDRRQTNFLWFSLFCLVAATRLSVINSVPLKVVWPEAPFGLMTCFRYVGFFLAAGLVALYQDSILKTSFARRVAYLFFAVSVLASLLVLITPPWIDSYVSFGFQIVTLSGIVLLYGHFIRQFRISDQPLLILMIGFSAIVIAFGHDALVANGLLTYPFWQNYGFAVYTIAQAIYFGLRYKSLNEELRSLHGSLTEYSLISQKKEAFEQKMLQQLAVLEQIGDKERAVQVKEMMGQIHQKPSMPVGHQVALDHLERINADFISRLKKRYPHLTPAEQELCICLKAKLSNRDIAKLRNISPDSVKKAKGRLRKKMTINTAEELFTYLNTV